MRVPEHVVLAGGREVVLRPVRPRDQAALKALLTGLSPRSRRWRFHGAVNALPCTALRELTRFDDDAHGTLVARGATADGRRRLVAEARWVRDADDPTRAEFALGVADDWQGAGLGRALVERLRSDAADAGVRLLYGSVLEENRPMLRLLQSFGARPRRDHRVGFGIVWSIETGVRSPGVPLHRRGTSLAPGGR